jgi:hypothetical protein
VDNQISLWHFDLTSFGGVITFFLLRIFRQNGGGWYLFLWVTKKVIDPDHLTLCDNICQWLATGRWFSRGTPASTTNNTDHNDITEILLKVKLNTIKPNLVGRVVHTNFCDGRTDGKVKNNMSPTEVRETYITNWGRRNSL